MYAGDSNTRPIKPGTGDLVFTTNAESGQLEEVKYLGPTGDDFDGKPYEKWIWLSGPDKGTCQTSYGRTFWTLTGNETVRQIT